MDGQSLYRDYYLLTKPGIVYSNAMTAVAGFLFASRGSVDFFSLAALSIGISLVIASACVFNNVIDRNIDKSMARTQNRALVKGTIGLRNALIFGSILSVGGFGLLIWMTNLSAAVAALIGFIVYLFLYGIGKRKTVYGTEIGSISGAMPIVAGYTAVSGNVDIAAFILFAIMVLWQMPHFYAIAVNRSKDYAAALIPVLPVKESLKRTKKQTILYIIGFTALMPVLSMVSHAGYSFTIIMTLAGSYWLWLGLTAHRNDGIKWARKMFGFSLVVLLIFSLMISISSVLP